MLGGIDAAGVAARQQLVERKAQVEHAIDGFALLRGVVQPSDQGERIADPDVAVAADMLHVQAGDAVGGEVAAEVAVAAARAADAVREHHQRNACARLDGRRQVQAHRHGATAQRVDPFVFDRAVGRRRGSGRRRGASSGTCAASGVAARASANALPHAASSRRRGIV